MDKLESHGKVMEKSHIMSWNFYNCTEKFCNECEQWVVDNFHYYNQLELLLLIRPPVYGSNGRFIKCSWCFSLFLYFFFRHAFSEFPRPIALKLCQMVGIWPNFIMQVQKLGGHSPQKNLGPKTCKISVDFGPLQTLIANISGTTKDIQNRPTLQTMAIPPAFNEKGPVNFGPLTAWNYMWVWTH